MAKRRRHTHAFVDAALARETDDCIIWPFAKNARGYPVMQDGRVHRIVCQRAHGAPTKRKNHACHSCGVKACVNKRHLYWGNAKTNMQDAMRLKEQPRGEASAQSRLRMKDVIAIRTSKRSSRDLAAVYGVSKTTINRARNGESWN